MTPYSYAAQKDRIRFADEIFDVLKTKAIHTPIRPGDIQALVNYLQCLLDIVKTSDRLYINDGPTFHEQLCRWQEEVDWKQCKSRFIGEDCKLNARLVYDFMSARAEKLPYPPHLYRAHIHGSPIPRFRDENTGDFCDTFGSDMHIFIEAEGPGEIPVTISEPSETCGTVEGLVGEVACHLKKTQINSNRFQKGEEPYFSQIVSLSGDLLWTTHTACQRGQMANEDQVAGLAVFQTSKIRESGVQIWRVRDLLKFFDSNPKFRSSQIDSFARTWAENADEYLCWDLVPKEALVNFVPFDKLSQQDDETTGIFLRPVFLTSKTLGNFRQAASPLEILAMEQYRIRISSFMMIIMDHIALEADADAEAFVNTIVKSFQNPSQWGYIVTSGGEDLGMMLRRVITAEYAWGKVKHPERKQDFQKVYDEPA